MLEGARGMRLHLTVRCLCGRADAYRAGRCDGARRSGAACGRQIRGAVARGGGDADVRLRGVQFTLTGTDATRARLHPLRTDSSGPCDAPVASGAKVAVGGVLRGLANGSYTFTVAATLTDGRTAIGTRTSLSGSQYRRL